MNNKNQNTQRSNLVGCVVDQSAEVRGLPSIPGQPGLYGVTQPGFCEFQASQGDIVRLASKTKHMHAHTHVN